MKRLEEVTEFSTFIHVIVATARVLAEGFSEATPGTGTSKLQKSLFKRHK